MAFDEDVMDCVNRITTDGGENNFLIISAGDLYMQFASSKGDAKLHAEVVSNEFLPEELMLSTAQMRQLNDIGFESPNKTENSPPNFFREYLINTEERKGHLLQDIKFTLFNILRIPEDTEFNLDVTLE